MPCFVCRDTDVSLPVRRWLQIQWKNKRWVKITRNTSQNYVCEDMCCQIHLLAKMVGLGRTIWMCGPVCISLTPRITYGKGHHQNYRRNCALNTSREKYALIIFRFEHVNCFENCIKPANILISGVEKILPMSWSELAVKTADWLQVLHSR